MSGRILVGFSHTLMCSAIGSGTLRYSWEISSNGSSWTTVSDVNTTSYVTNTSLHIGQYMYRCNVSNEAGSVVSDNATVIVYGECLFLLPYYSKTLCWYVFLAKMPNTIKQVRRHYVITNILMCYVSNCGKPLSSD